MLLTTKKRNPLSDNQPSNNWTQLVFKGSVERVGGQPPDCKFNTLKHCLYPEIMPCPYNSMSLRGRDFSSSPTAPPPPQTGCRLSPSEVSLAFVPFCHLGEGHHLTGLPPAYLFLLEPELVGEPKLLAAEDDPPTCLRGAFAPTAITDNSVKHEDMEL